MTQFLFYAPPAAILLLTVAFYFFRSMRVSNPGTLRMIEIAGKSRVEAEAWRKAFGGLYWKVLAAGAILLALVAAAGFLSPLVPIVFLGGAVFSTMTSYVSQTIEALAPNRIAAAARFSAEAARRIALRASAAAGLFAGGFILLDASIWIPTMQRFGGENRNLLALAVCCFARFILAYTIHQKKFHSEDPGAVRIVNMGMTMRIQHDALVGMLYCTAANQLLQEVEELRWAAASLAILATVLPIVGITVGYYFGIRKGASRLAREAELPEEVLARLAPGVTRPVGLQDSR